MFNPFLAYVRWRHSKGYGIHSPFAYRFVTDVLNPKSYGYYAYWNIDELLKGKENSDYRLIHRVKFIIRLAIFLNSKCILSQKNCREAEIAAKSLHLEWLNVNKQRGLNFEKPQLLIIDDSFSDVKFIKSYLSGLKDNIGDSRMAVMAINPKKEIRQLLETPISRGVLFTDSHRLILIPRPEMAYISYPIILR